MMELKEYQVRCLDNFDHWLKALEESKRASISGLKALTQQGVPERILDELRNYPKSAWESAPVKSILPQSAGVYIPRTDEAGQPIPHICFKVPTGGGKTLLAAAALDRLNRQTGLVLWIVPRNAIYEQTKNALWSREHPYRQMLERASDGRVKMLLKDDQFGAADIDNYLCVMLISLQSANRWNNKEFLRMFRDSGRYPTLFPDSDDILAEGRLLQSHPDLERAYAGGPIKHSLFNVCKIHSPVVVLDEAHKAYGKRSGAVEEFVQSINRFDPSMVIELTATPDPKISNLLVDISGVELKNEEMIKLPIRVDTTTEAEWYYTLNWAAEKLEQLAGEANILQHREGRYIRPIAVVRVERTGKAQIENEQFLHAQRVRNYLIQRLGVPENEIAIKSADNNELKGVNLLAESCPVRWIITKDALREGWDCAFAYVLVMLDKTSAETAITQLVGRVMRQPGAQRTGVSALDQSYVFCWDLNVEKAVLQVRKGLEQEGLNDLGDDVLGGESLGIKPLLVQRRVGFRGKTIYLPRVLHQEYGNWIDLDYHKHILPEIDWDSIGAPENIPRSLPDTVRRQTAAVDVDTDPIYDVQQTANVVPTLEISWFARRLSDLIPNPWQAARIVQELLQQLRDSEESEEEIYARRSFLAFFLQQHVADKVTELSEIVFRKKLRDGDIRFDLELGEPNYRMVESYELPIPANDSHFQRNHAQPLQLSLFDPIYNSQFDSTPERQFAKYLDEQKALHWWHRVAARQRNEYYYQGWKRERIYPDFIAMASEENGKPCLLIFETKGLHLSGNPDTTYKQRVMEVLEGAFNAGKVTVHNGPVKGVFKILFREVEFSTALAPCME